MSLAHQKGVPNGPKSVLRSPLWTKKGIFRGPIWTNIGVLRGPSRIKKVLPLPFFVALRGPSWTKGCCRCRSSWSFVALSGQKGVAVAVAVLRGPSWPFAALRGQKVLPLQFFVVLSGPSWTKRSCRCRCRSSRPFATLRGQKDVAVAVLRGPSWPFVDKKMLPLPFFATLRGQKDVAVAVPRAPSWTKRCCRACPQNTPTQPLATVDIPYNLL